MLTTTSSNRSCLDGPSRRTLQGAALVVVLFAVGCAGVVERGSVRAGGEPVIGWTHAVTYPWAWLDLSAHGDPGSTFGPTPSELALRGGWGSREAWGRWALAPAAEVELSLEFEAPYDLLIEVRAPDAGSEPLEITLDDEVLGEIQPEGEWTTHRLRVERLLAAGSHRLRLTSPGEESADAFLGGAGRAAGVRRLGLVPSGSKEFPAPQASLPTEGANRGVMLTRTATHLVPIGVPRDADVLQVTVEADVLRRGSGRAIAFEASLLTLDGQRSTAVRMHPRPSGRTIDHLEIDLEPFRGRSVSLLLSAAMPTAGAQILIHPPTLHRTSTTEPALDTPATKRPAGSEPPDIVLIILDAARADAFSLYGAERPTTPNLDRLAEEALVFEDATADCPYTLCSSPTILTGLTFLRHGVVDKGLRVDDAVPTLAERLRDSGYYTIGLTSNPNNSGRIGLHRGFEDYRNTWNKAGPTRARDPARLHGFAEEALERAPTGQPLFLMAHYVPPHEPYAPTPPYDLFTDPDYEGIVTRRVQRQQKILRNQFELDERDLAQFRALYDGNLRMADAWTQRLFDLLDQHDRFDEAVVVVTSDHGEAFLEHGHFGHNSTIYEEMMRVPLLVRLPTSWHQPPLTIDRLVSLADLTPTLLRLAGADGVDATEGVDLLSIGDPDRVVFLRSSQAEGNSWGARTGRFKIVVDPHQGALYDLERDPRERTNLVADQLALYSTLRARLEAAVDGAGRGRSETSALSAEERQTLEALGYL